MRVLPSFYSTTTWYMGKWDFIVTAHLSDLYRNATRDSLSHVYLIRLIVSLWESESSAAKAGLDSASETLHWVLAPPLTSWASSSPSLDRGVPSMTNRSLERIPDLRRDMGKGILHTWWGSGYLSLWVQPVSAGCFVYVMTPWRFQVSRPVVLKWLVGRERILWRQYHKSWHIFIRKRRKQN